MGAAVVIASAIVCGAAIVAVDLRAVRRALERVEKALYDRDEDGDCRRY